MTASAFDDDPHTIVKQLGRKPFDLATIFRASFLANLERRTHVNVKAVDETSGKIVGHAGWSFRGLDGSKVPWKGPGDMKPTPDDVAEDAGTTGQTPGAKSRDQDDDAKLESDAIDRLHELEDRDMQHWLTVLIPQGESCAIILGLTVAPEHQSRGVGTALIKYGNELADQAGVDVWVHSSQQAWQAYCKCGFEVEKTLPVDLDAYAPRGPRDGEPVMDEGVRGKWGLYTIRYMKRIPQH